MNTLVPAQDNTSNTTTLICLPDLMSALGYTHHSNLKSRFETFLNRAKRCGNQLIYKSYTYIAPDSFKVADSYMMDMTTAKAFASYVEPARPADASPFDTMPKRNEHKKLGGFVYLLRCEGYYKIGKSTKSVKARVAACQTGNPFHIALIHYVAVDNCAACESRLHAKFDKYRSRGEWFSRLDVDEVVRAMDEMKKSPTSTPRPAINGCLPSVTTGACKQNV